MKRKDAKAGPSTKLRAGKFAGLRAKAEAILEKKIIKLRKQSPGDLEKVMHELGVYQIELEMQNEELRAAQQELETSRNKYSDLYDFAPVGYFTFDKHGLVLEANLTGCRMLGVERAKLIKKPFHTVVDKDSQDRFYLHRQEVAKTAVRQTCEITLVRKNRDKFPALLETIPATDEKGELNFCRTAVTDITERKQLEQLKEAINQQTISERNRLEALMEALPTGVAIVDAEGGSVLSNAAYGQVWGKPSSPVRTIKDYKAWWPDTGKPVKPEEWASAQAIEKGKTVIGQLLEIERFDGTRAFVLNSAAPILDGAGKIAGSAVAIQDITEQHKAEETLKQIRAELERSNKELEEFAYITSHDLHEPLRAISGFIQLLDQRYKDKWDDKAKEYIKFVIDGARRMDDLITGLLECSRIQTQGQMTVPISAGMALNLAIRNLQKDIDETGASITFDELPDVKANGRQLIQVFQNLIGNAIKFQIEQKPQIHVGCKKQENHWQFSVRDNGIGIESQYHERIFKLFQRLHPHDQYSGYGVGLTICQKIVERHGGKIWVESQAGQGTTFYFTIPQ